MIFLNITFVLPHDLESEFVGWLRMEAPVPDSARGIAGARLLRVLPPAEDCRLALQIEFAGREALTAWQDTWMEGWLRKVFEIFNSRVLPFATVLEPLDL